MTINIQRDIARDEVLRLFKAGRRASMIVEDLKLPESTVRRWLVEAGLVRSERNGDQRAFRNAMEARERVDRDPCPRCNIRKDIGCKHYPKEVPQMTLRDQAAALWA